MDHEILEARIFCLDRLDAVDHMRRRSAKPRLLLHPVGQRGHARWRSGSAPGPALFVGVADKAERGKPLVTLVMRRLEAADRLLLGVSKVDAGTPDHVLAQLFRPSVPGAGGVIGAHDVVEDLLAVQGNHRLEALFRHQADGLTTGDRHPDLDRQVLGPRHHGDFFELVSAIGNRRRALEILAFEVKRLLVEAFQQKIEPLLKNRAVGFGVKQRGTEGLHFAGVIAAPDTHDDPAIGHDVGHCVVFGEPDRVPHRQNVEGAAEFETPGLGGEPKPELDQVRQALVAFALEMVLGGPKAVVTELVHQPSDIARGPEYLAQALIRVAAVVRRRAVAADIIELDLTDIERMKPFDHVVTNPPSPSAGSPRRPRPACRAQPDAPHQGSSESLYVQRSPRRSGRHSCAARCGPRHPRSAGSTPRSMAAAFPAWYCRAARKRVPRLHWRAPARSAIRAS